MPLTEFTIFNCKKTLVATIINLISNRDGLLQVKVCYWTNTTCFLSRRGWISIMRDAASQASGRKRATLEFFLMSAPIFDLLVECTNFVMGQDVPGHNHATRHKLLLEKLTKSGRKFFDWTEEWIADVSQPDSVTLSTIAQKRKVGIDTWLEYVLDFQSMVTLIYKRLYVSLGGDRAAQVERQAQSMAEEVHATYKRRSNSSEFQESIALTLAVDSILSTATDWANWSGNVSEGCPELAPLAMYACWVKKMGIRVDINRNKIEADD